MAILEVITGQSAGGVTAARGFRAGAASAHVKADSNRNDLAIVVSDQPCVAHAVFTQCQVAAAPVLVSRERIAHGRAQGIILNSGNANACTGEQGLADARAMAEAAAKPFGIDPALMLVASTGVIGVPLPMDRVQEGISRLQPTENGAHDAALAIMTTDTYPKEAAVSLEIDGQRITIGGMAKGSGMIHPNMATMLAVLTTDAPLDPLFARRAVHEAADESFNQVSVDRDTSTNDMALLLANGAVEIPPIRAGTPQATQFQAALNELCVQLARLLARDGEGSTRLVSIDVESGHSHTEARAVARSIAASSLVKAAIYGKDPNWGRIVAAVGNAGVPIDPNRIDVFIGEVQVAAQGAYAPHDAAAVSRAMGADEVSIRVALNLGEASGRAWGCDLTEGYVKINAEYTT
jgi:glutamate N-acetyltransferase / amino-acid N-acetyltransferase